MTAPPTRHPRAQRSLLLLALALVLGVFTAAFSLGLLPTSLQPYQWPLVHGLSVLATIVLAAAFGVALRSTQQAQATLQAAAEREHMLFDALPTGVVVWGPDDRFVLCNADFRRLYPQLAPCLKPGFRFEDTMRHALDAGLVPEAKGREAQWLEERVALHQLPISRMVRQMADGHWRRIVEQRLPDGSTLGHSVDITELVQREQELVALNQRLDQVNAELAQLSDTDPLTGLANRRHFDRRLAQEFARARRHGVPLALAILDVDHFKRFNDRHGHAAGDLCLQHVAALLRAGAQRPTDLVARLGGEEFALLLPHHDVQDAITMGQRCLSMMQAAALPHGDSPVADYLTLSIGVADLDSIAPDAGPEALPQAADAAMYAAKRAGRNRLDVAPSGSAASPAAPATGDRTA